MPDLSDAEKDDLIAAIREDRPLPLRYRASLFDDAARTELVWPGKSREVEQVALPFQSIEHVDEPRAETVASPTLFSLDAASGRQSGGWTNKLIWGDNKLVLASLLNGPLRQQIEEAGGLRLVYIDPPFDVGADFEMDVEVGEDTITKQPSYVEEIAYRDTWGRGRDSFASMLFERIKLIHDLLEPGGSLFLHLDWRTSSIGRLILDEVFGSDNIRNELIWCYFGPSSPGQQHFNRKHDTIWWYSKRGADHVFNRDDARIPYHETTAGKWDSEGTGFGGEAPDFSKGKIAEDWWSDIPIAARRRTELTGYPTQKPEKLLERILSACSGPDDLVADFFVGSGTTAAMAERMGRKWIAVDLGRFSVHTTRKRLIGVQRELAAEGKPYRAFEILNLGSYERQYFAGVDMSLPPEQRRASSLQRQEQWLSLVLDAYGARAADQLTGFQGTKGTAAVLVGALDAPVTQSDIRAALEGAMSIGFTRVDVLGFEFEMGIKPAMADEARDEGLSLSLRYIPHEVFDRRAVSKGQVKFFDVGYVEVKPHHAADGSVSVELTDFGVFYRQEDADGVAASMRAGSSRITIDGGQVVRLLKDKSGIVRREIITKSWTDWIDYWAVDFDFESQREIVHIQDSEREGNPSLEMWTGRYIFENRWQDFRTRSSRTLQLVSAPHKYDAPGQYKVAVKVIDVFGNDTTKVISIEAK